MRKVFAVMLCGVMLAAVWSVPAFAEYWNEGNSGDSWETAYVIDSVSDFMQMSSRGYQETGKYYKLTADLDLTNEDLRHGGVMLTGHFDGQDHTITISLNTTNSAYYSASLFSQASNIPITIRNLKAAGTVRANEVAGGIIEMLKNGVIENCSFTGTVEAVRNVDDNIVVWAGGIAGHLGGYDSIAENHAPIIRNCTFSGTIRSSGINNGDSGGIAADISNGRIENSAQYSQAQA